MNRTNPEPLILEAMDAALNRVANPEGHHSGAYGMIHDALFPLCHNAYRERAQAREAAQDPGSTRGT